ncbi:MAG: hypothetical protein NZ839_01670 [Endomicrobia bacterium]|nr:hypothetical protein [Endomicrobiia bacterium]
MKNGLMLVVIFCCLLVLVGCPKLPSKLPVSIPSVVEQELTGLYLTTDPKQMSGVGRSTIKLGVGESTVIYVRGDSNGKWIELPADVVVNWKADKELEVTPNVGHVVTIKVIRPISASSFATATTTTKSGKKIEALLMVTPK